MEIPGRRKKDGPSKTVIELFLYFLLYREEAFLCEDVLEELKISKRTLFRYIRDLKMIFPESEIHHSGRDGRDEFSAYDLTDEYICSFFPDEPHLNHLARLIRLSQLLEEKEPWCFEPDDEDDPVFASRVKELAEKATLPKYKTLRMVQRDLVALKEASTLLIILKS